MLRLVQLFHPVHGRRVAVVSEPQLRLLQGCSTVYELVTSAIRSNQRLHKHIEQRYSSDELEYDAVYEGRSDWQLLAPIDHSEPSRCFITGTGLTHKGSAKNRQSMHEVVGSKEQGTRTDEADFLFHAPGSSLPAQTDSMKMFQIGLEGGRPAPGCIGAAPEWFYKGVGTILRAHNQPLSVPPHGLDGGEEAEVAGVYIISAQGMPCRIGLAQGNEFSDHVMESKNYLYLAPSKLRDCSLGPELVVEPTFDDVPGSAAIERGGKVIWQAAQATGEQRMCHSVANLEHHHFKHDEHRRPGDVHVHFFGADEFSYKDKLRIEDGDVMSVAFEGFGRPLRNPIRINNSDGRLVIVESV
jgi:hypothetical protein